MASDTYSEPRRQPPHPRRIAFVLGGGGELGACEVGMLRALLEHSIVPDLIVGTSVGALNGAAIAADPSVRMVKRLEDTWRQLGEQRLFASPLRAAATLIRDRTHLHSNQALRRLARLLLPVERFEDLTVEFQCVAAAIERAAEHWFSQGPLIEAILASCAVPGLLPPVLIDGEHFLDGGIVNSIPIERALALGATEVYVLQVGRIERPLVAPRNLVQVMTVTFEIARRHRFAHDLAALEPGLRAHVLPTGDEQPPGAPHSPLRPWDFGDVGGRINRAHAATTAYLDAGQAQP